MNIESILLGWGSSKRRKSKKSKRSKKNPGFYRSKRYKYLGKRVKDVGKKGLDKISEYRGILRAIIKDLKSGKISKKTARGRLLLLYRLTFPSKNKKIRGVSKTTLKRLRSEIRNAMKKYT